MNIMGNQSATYGIFNAVMSAHKNHKVRKNVQRSNQSSRNLNDCAVDIANVFQSNFPVGNVMFSGDDFNLRNEVIVEASMTAFFNGSPVIIIHSSNNNLNSMLELKLGNKLTEFGLAPPYGAPYDPLKGYSDQELINNILCSSSGVVDIKGPGVYYLEGITRFIRSKGVVPYLMMYLTCPHAFINDKVLEAQINGYLTQKDATEILTYISQGESEKSNIELFFRIINQQLGPTIANKSNLGYSESIRSAVSKGSVVSFNLSSYVNQASLNILLTEIDSLVSKGLKPLIIFDDVKHASSGMVKEFISRSGVDYYVFVSSSDTYSSLDSDEGLFKSFTSSCTHLIITHHGSRISCQRMSELTGEYDKTEINVAYNDTTHRMNIFTIIPGTANTVTQNLIKSREAVVKQEEISNLGNREAVLVINDGFNDGVWKVRCN